MSLELIKPGTRIDFIGQRRLCAMLSVLVICASFVAIPIQGIRLGIDFAGGNEMQVKFVDETVDENSIRAVLGELPDIEEASVVRFGAASENEFLVRFRGGEASEAEVAEETGVELPGEDRVQRFQEALQENLGGVVIQRVEFVGPRVGAELQSDGLMSLFWASLAILAYVAVRFSSRFAPGAVVAVIHDLLVTAGIFVILGLEFDLRILAAMLAILGYSLNDTIIIYDRIRENMELRTKADLEEVLNLSVNQTLARTVLTSGTTLAALLALYFLGGEVIRPFAFAMLIGVAVGTYSSIYIASPLLLLLEGRTGSEASAS
ncbi:MAG: protein translocase subunit SecF [Myxococcota bacterium]|nr:protein translocase subunit SecF [Myxococcota bacterium]